MKTFKKKHILLIILLLIIQYSLIAQSNLDEESLNKLETTGSIYSNILEEQRDFWIKLPENYNPKRDLKYPVIYLLDGFSQKKILETVYDNYWGHYLPHMIIVGISNKTNRTRDLTISQIKMRRGTVMNSETGGAEAFTQFIEEELIPHIDSIYPTTQYRTLIGHSYAGLFTINTLLNHQHLFENYIAIDPSIEWDNQKLLKEAKEKFKIENFKGKSLFVSLAAEQLHMQNENVTIDNIMSDTTEFSLFARSIIEFSNIAKPQKQNELNFSWKVYPEDLHGTVPLPSMRDGLIFLFKWYQFKHPQKYNNPETPIEELIALLKKQEEIYTSHLGYPTPPMLEELLSGYGFMNMQMGQPEKALMFLKMNIEYYPKNPIAFDLMVDYYEYTKDKASALKYAMKAFKIEETEERKSKIEMLKN